jgi:peptidyl-prolyl cis-trans isomerase SurA
MNHWKAFKLEQVKKALVAVVLSSLLGSVNSWADMALLDRVVAVVDDDVVLQSELNQRMATVYSQIKKSGTQAPTEEILKKQVLERLIKERLQLNIGYKAGVRISDQEVDQTVARLAANNNLSMEEYVSQIHASGGTMTTVRQEITNELIIMRVQQGRVMRGIRISEQELDNFLNSEEGKLMTSPDVKLGHILLSVSSNSSAEDATKVSDQLNGIIQQIAEGADFRQLAIANSDDQSALEGGDLGWRKMAQLPSLFTEAIQDLQPSEISKPIRSGAGFHLLKLYDRRGGGEQLIEQHFARHILLKPNQIRDQATTIDKLNELRQKIISGEDFAALSKQFSEDLGSALNGGELGWSTPGMFVPEFEKTMNSIAINEVSEPFQSQFGWHILQVTERREQDFSDDILRNSAENLLRQRKFSEELQVWLQKIRDEAFVELKET